MPYSLLVVDDEEEIRRGIVDSIDWADWGYHVMGEASSGEEAVALIEAEPPDVVMTDIRMPGMDGVALMRYLHQNHPSIKVVVLSGFSDFEYMKTSIQSEVTTYLLKPTNLVEFEQAFRDIKVQLDQLRAADEEKKRADRQIQQSLAYRRSQLFSRLLSGHAPREEELQHQLDQIQVSLPLKRCRVCVVAMHYSAEYLRYTSEKDKLWIKEQIVALLQQNLEQDLLCQGEVFLNDQKIVTAFLCGSRDALQQFFDKMVQLIQTRQGVPVHVGISEECGGVQGMPFQYRCARSALDRPAGKTSFCEYREPWEGAVGAPAVQYPDDRVLTAAMLECNVEKLKQDANAFFEQLSADACPDYSSIDLAVMKYLLHLGDCAARIGLDLPKLGAEGNVLLKSVYEIECITGKKHFVLYLLGLLEKALARQRFSTGSDKLMQEIREYIDSSFCSEQLSLHTVADAVQKNPAYISRFFKEYFGVNFIQYVRDKRMAHALQLLRQGNLRVYEVARRVGYTDVSNFMKTFKKYYNVTPADYQLIKGDSADEAASHPG